MGEAIKELCYAVKTLIDRLRVIGHLVEMFVSRLRMVGKKFHGLREGFNSLVNIHLVFRLLLLAG